MINLNPFPFRATCVLLDKKGIVDSSGNMDDIRPWKSVTKILTAICVLQAVDADQLALTDPLGPATLADVLSHSSGLAADFDKTLAAPRRRRIYSSYGYDLIGEYFREKTGIGIGDWMHKYLLPDLDMDTTELNGSPAHAASGSTRDMARLAGALLRAEVLPAHLDAALTTPHNPGLPGVLPGYGTQNDNLWGMGCEIRGQKTPHWTAPESSAETFGHFGMSGSFLWVDRGRGLAAVFTGTENFGPLHKQHWPTLNSQLLQLANR